MLEELLVLHHPWGEESQNQAQNMCLNQELHRGLLYSIQGLEMLISMTLLPWDTVFGESRRMKDEQ